MLQRSGRRAVRAELPCRPVLGERDDGDRAARTANLVAHPGLARAFDAVRDPRAGDHATGTRLAVGKDPEASIGLHARDRRVGRCRRDGAGHRRIDRLVATAAAGRRKGDQSEHECVFHTAHDTKDTTPNESSVTGGAQPRYEPLRSISSMRYSSGSRTKQRSEPPSRRRYGSRSGSIPCSARPASVAAMSSTASAMWP